MTKRHLGLMISGAMAAMVAAAPARAQQAPATPDTDTQTEDVIVTAQKREQTLVDVPQSVSVVGGTTLERNQAVSFQDYAKLVPGLNVTQSNPGEARLVLRGINTGGVAATVATYVDETPFGSSSGLVNSAILSGEFDTFDVARVEVLRGPQGTLYGASSLGGVLKFVTNEPSTKGIEARARGSVESTDGGEASYMGSALVNVPLGETLAVRASGFYRNYGGWIESIGVGGSDIAKDINGSESYGGRISALFKPSETFSVRLTAILQNTRTDAGNLVEVDPATFRTLYGRPAQSQYYPQVTDVRYRLYNGAINADLGFATITSSTSYATLKEKLRDDNTVYYGAQLGLYSDATGPAVDLGLDQQTNVERWTQEVRLASNPGVFEWLVGGYYSHEKGAILQFLQAYDQGTETPSTALPLLADIFLTSKYEEIAGFANGTLHLGSKFDLTFGGRYSHNSQSAAQGGTGLLAPAALGAKSDENVFTWSVAPKFKFSETSAVYARVAKGFRPGGPNIIPPAAPAGTPNTYKSDSLISYEIGAKAETADRKFGIDVAAFHIDWDDVQLLAVVNGYGVNTNGGKATSDGFEFTATARPTRGLTATITGAYTDAKLSADTDPLVVGGRKGDKLPFVPEWSVTGSADYDWAIGSTATAFVGATIQIMDKLPGNYSPDYLATYGRQIVLPSYQTIDLRAGVDLGRFSIELYARNVTNSEGKVSATYTAPPSFPNGAAGAGVIRPRAFGVTLGAGF